MKDHLETLGHASAFNELLKLAKSNTITEKNDEQNNLHSS